MLIAFASLVECSGVELGIHFALFVCSWIVLANRGSTEPHDKHELPFWSAVCFLGIASALVKTVEGHGPGTFRVS